MEIDEKIFRSAINFDHASHIVQNEAGNSKKHSLLFPFSTLDAFAVELYLKCIYSIYVAKNPIEEHSLEKLYLLLPNTARQILENEFRKLMIKKYFQAVRDSDPKSILQSRKFSQLISKADQSFIASRYLYEAGNELKFNGIWALPMKIVLRSHIIRMKPEFELHVRAQQKRLIGKLNEPIKAGYNLSVKMNEDCISPSELNFKWAVTYDWASHKVMQQYGDEMRGESDAGLFSPFLTLDALAVELYLKSLLKIEGDNKVYKKHDLKYLLNKISSNSQLRLETIFNDKVIGKSLFKNSRNNIELGLQSATFKSLIEIGRHTFDAARFSFDEEEFKKFKVFWGGPLKMTLRLLILEINPTYLKFLFPRQIELQESI
jgi:HEPN domain-containing protein